MTASYRSHVTAGSYYYNSATPSLTKPSGAVEGDVLVAVFVNNDPTRELTGLPSGWTLLRNTEESGTAATEMWVAKKKLGSSEPASYTFTFNFNFNGAAQIICFQDCDDVSIHDAASVSGVQSGPYTGTAPSISVPSGDSLVVGIYGIRFTTTGATPTFDPPAGYTTRVTALSSIDERGLAVCDKVQVSSGSSGTAEGEFTVTGGGSGRTHAVHLAISSAVTSYVAHPDEDISSGTWTASESGELYEMLDEESPSDSDYIEATTPGACEVKLSSIVSPPSGWLTRVRYRILGDVTVSLRQGSSTEIASWAESEVSAATIERTLSSGEQSSISDWSDLRLRFTKPA